MHLSAVGVAKLRCARGDPLEQRCIRSAPARTMRSRATGNRKSNAWGQSSPRNSSCVSARQLEARGAARGSCQTWLEAHDPVLQNEALWYCATPATSCVTRRRS